MIIGFMVSMPFLMLSFFISMCVGIKKGRSKWKKKLEK